MTNSSSSHDFLRGSSLRRLQASSTEQKSKESEPAGVVQTNTLTSVANTSPWGEIVMVDLVGRRRVALAYICGRFRLTLFGPGQTAEDFVLERDQCNLCVAACREHSLKPWRNWPGRASACWPGPRPIPTRPGWAHSEPCSSCWSQRWGQDCSTSPGPSRRPEEWRRPWAWRWWGNTRCSRSRFSLSSASGASKYLFQMSLINFMRLGFVCGQFCVCKLTSPAPVSPLSVCVCASGTFFTAER